MLNYEDRYNWVIALITGYKRLTLDFYKLFKFSLSRLNIWSNNYISILYFVHYSNSQQKIKLSIKRYNNKFIEF